MEKYTIKRLTFEEEEMERLRPNAVAFAKAMHNTFKLPVYQVLYKDGVYPECLVICVYRRYKTGKEKLEIIRCVGPTKIKRHWEPIRNILSENRKLIQSLKKQNQLVIDYSKSA